MDEALFFRLAADALLLLHVVFVVFVVAGLALVIAGAFRNWQWVRNPSFRTAHVAAIVVVAAQAWLGRVCPLTVGEMALRQRAGDAVYRGSFIAHWLDELLYFDAPQWVFTLLYTSFAVLVGLTWFLVRPRPFAR